VLLSWPDLGYGSLVAFDYRHLGEGRVGRGLLLAL
jgi:hypothetical protein